MLRHFGYYQQLLTYPVGDGTNYRPITLNSSNTNTNSLSAAYMFATQNQSSLNSSLSSIKNYGWDIQRSSGSDGLVLPFHLMLVTVSQILTI